MLYVQDINIITTLIAVLKELIGYSDYSFEIVIFKSFETNQIFIFNTSHLCSKAFYLLFHHVHNITCFYRVIRDFFDKSCFVGNF